MARPKFMGKLVRHDLPEQLLGKLLHGSGRESYRIAQDGATDLGPLPWASIATLVSKGRPTR